MTHSPSSRDESVDETSTFFCRKEVNDLDAALKMAATLEARDNALAMRWASLWERERVGLLPLLRMRVVIFIAFE
jgi:hypothetical protein